MAETTYGMSYEDARKTVSLLRAEANRIEGLLESQYLTLEFDPRLELPPVVLSNKGTDEQKTWSSIVLLGLILAHEIKFNRGATKAESRAISKAAGFSSGNTAWNGWVPDICSFSSIELRELSENGMKRLVSLYEKVNRKMPSDMRKAAGLEY